MVQSSKAALLQYMHSTALLFVPAVELPDYQLTGNGFLCKLCLKYAL